MRYILYIVLGSIFIACQTKDFRVIKDSQERQSNHELPFLSSPQDLEKIPQNVDSYTNSLQTKDISQLQNKYDEHYFSVWSYEKPQESTDDVMWAFERFDENNSFGENLLPIKQGFFDQLHENSNSASYLTLSKKGVVVSNVDLRAMPTNQPVLRDPSIAGEGFPFDYMQNSSVNANTPVFISHASKDKQWLFIFTSFAYGWVSHRDVVFLKDEYVDKWKNSHSVTVFRDEISLFNSQNKPLYNTRIGMRFPIIEETQDYYLVLALSSYTANQPYFNQVKISKKIATKRFLEFSKSNIDAVVQELQKSNYGWGGIYGQRDCSSTLMDLYSVFGIWLPRNSLKQSQVGAVINLEGLSDSEKLQKIKETAVPFETLLYKPGHIVMYVGMHNDEIVIFQNIWGIKTKQENVEGRYIIGRTVFSTLQFGKKLKDYNKEAELLKNITSINFVTR